MLKEILVLLVEKLGKVISIGFAAVVMAVIIIYSIISYYSHDLPDYNALKNYTPYTVSRVYSANGKLMKEYGYEKRIYVPYDEIPELIINAFLAAEDKDYFQHEGINPVGVFKAAITNILKAGKRPVGRSTITQQVVKNILLNNEMTIARKVKEAVLAYRISRVFSKEHILELYLNQIFLGDSAYGVASAALNYFNKDLGELDIEEAAVLASLPKAPTTLNPRKKGSKIRYRRDWVIKRMAEEGFITANQAQKSIKRRINLKDRRKLEFADGNFYTEKAKYDIINMLGERKLNKEGISVFTNFDNDIQKMATKALRNGIQQYDKRRGYRGPVDTIIVNKNNLKDFVENYELPADLLNNEVAVVTSVYQNGTVQLLLKRGSKAYILAPNYKWALGKNKTINDIIKKGDVIVIGHFRGNSYKLEQIPQVNGAVVVMEPVSGKVRALVGGYDFNTSMFDRALQAYRQPGSVFKPFVYVAALEKGYAPNSIIGDEPIAIEQGVSLPTWIPKNYSNNYLGPITLRKSLEKSANLAVINISKIVGLKKVNEVSQRFGIYKNPPEIYSMALGSYETTLVNMTNAFNILASGGKKTVPSYIDRIYDKKGNVLYKDNNFECKGCIENYTGILPRVQSNMPDTVSEDINYQMVSMLEGVVKRGTSRRANVLKHNIAGKTGTTNDSKDAWYIGFSPDVTIGVYIGYDKPQTLGNNETGATVALPVYVEIMRGLKKNMHNSEFVAPKGIKIVKIDSQTGLLPDEHTKAQDVIKEAFTIRQLPEDNFKAVKELSGLFGKTISTKKYIAVEEEGGYVGEEFGGLY